MKLQVSAVATAQLRQRHETLRFLLCDRDDAPETEPPWYGGVANASLARTLHHDRLDISDRFA
ncbi:MAG: hypothetical protein AAGD07_09675, partial [Planctomycetota bacterium]